MKYAIIFILLFVLSSCNYSNEHPQLQLFAGSARTYIVTEAGELWGWGHMHGGDELCIWCGGFAVFELLENPTKIMEDVVYVSRGGLYTMAIKRDNSLWAWGWNEFGQFGDCTDIDRYEPVRVMENVVAVSHARSRTLAITDDNTLWEWGLLRDKDGTLMQQRYPLKILDDVVAVSTSNSFVMALRTDNTLWGWGLNASGILGDESIVFEYHPFQILDNVIAFDMRGALAMAIRTDGSLWSWGNNFHNQLGDGTCHFINRSYPVQIMEDVVAVEIGGTHVMAIRGDGSLWAWGCNMWGQIGNGSNASLTQMAGNLVELDISGYTERDIQELLPIWIMDDVVSISAGMYHSIAITTDGTLWSWGGNHAGQLGDGTTINSSTPRPIYFMRYINADNMN